MASIFLHDGFGFAALLAIGEQHIGAGFGQAQRDGAADAAAAAGDDGDFPASEKRLMLISCAASTRRAASAMKGAVMPKCIGQLFRLARGAERILHADEFDRAGHGRGQGFGHRAAKPAMDIVIFGGDDGAGFPRAARQQRRRRSA